MNDAIAQLNALSSDAAAEALRGCCGAEVWFTGMAARRPFRDAAALHAAADEVFSNMHAQNWMEAFACHPQIGDLDSLRMKFAGNREWSHGEQQGVTAANEATLAALAAGNAAYLQRFGYIFIVCASGKSAAEMLGLLTARLGNSQEVELPIAAAEQRKITRLRIDKLLGTLGAKTQA